MDAQLSICGLEAGTLKSRRNGTLLQLLGRHRLYRLAIACRLSDVERNHILIRHALGDLDVDAVVVTQRHRHKPQMSATYHWYVRLPAAEDQRIIRHHRHAS